MILLPCSCQLTKAYIFNCFVLSFLTSQRLFHGSYLSSLWCCSNGPVMRCPKQSTYNTSTAELNIHPPSCPVTTPAEGKVLPPQLCPKTHIKKWKVVWTEQMVDASWVCDAKQLPWLSFQITLEMTALEHGAYLKEHLSCEFEVFIPTLQVFVKRQPLRCSTSTKIRQSKEIIILWPADVSLSSPHKLFSCTVGVKCLYVREKPCTSLHFPEKGNCALSVMLVKSHYKNVILFAPHNIVSMKGFCNTSY